jgi:signal transduction histidine kinase
MFLLIVNLIILAIPISGLYLFRVYENELVRQTESELIVQAALVASFYRDRLVGLGGPDYGLPHWSRPLDRPRDLRIVPTRLDRSSPVSDRPMTWTASAHAPDPVAMAAAAELAPVIEEAGLTTLSTITLLDFRGLAVGPERGRGLSLASNEEVAAALQGRYHSLLRARAVRGPTSLASASRDTPFRAFAAMPVFNGQRLAGVVCLSRTPRELAKALYQERWNLILAGALIVSLMVFVSLASSLLLIGPVKRLAAEAARAAEDPVGPAGRGSRWDLVAVREIFDLKAAVFDMAERLGRRSDYLKAFASGVSHEFKTPLSAIKGAMELIGEHGRDMDPEVFERFSRNIALDLERLERLVARLLALAKAEAIQATRQERTGASALAGSLAGRYALAHPSLRIEIEAPPEEIELAIEADVLETALLNLLDNSRESGASAARVVIGAAAGLGSIRVSDDGPGLAPESAEKIFTPFFTTRSNSGGTGLGLSLARTLLAPYQGRLELVGPPAVFEITVPLAPPIQPPKPQPAKS